MFLVLFIYNICGYLQVRLEHILERIALISDAANTEKPSLISSTLFIGGALAARSQYTLQHLGITHILCLCSNEIGQSDSQYPDIFQYKNFSVSALDFVHLSMLSYLAYVLLIKFQGSYHQHETNKVLELVKFLH